MQFQRRGTTRLLPFTPSPEAIRGGRFASTLDEFPDSHMRYSAVVLGLTIHPMEWPPWYQPHELEPIEPIPHTPRERNSMADW